MSYALPRDPTECIENHLKACLQDFHCAQLFIACYRDGCWEYGKEITEDMCAVNLYTISDNPDERKTETFADCMWKEQAMVASLRFEVHALHCIDRRTIDQAQLKARRCWRLIYARLCHCWRNKQQHNLLWDDLKFTGADIEFRNDPAKGEQAYAVITAGFNAHYREDPCNPGVILRSC